VIRRHLIAGALLAVLAGCPADTPLEDDIVLYGLTAAPPASIATIVSSDTSGYTITLTHGVAIAARCWDSCDYTCVAPQLTSADTDVLRVRPVWRSATTSTTGEVALIASGPGSTTLRVETACSSRVYTVTVQPQ
jgi:hypothetical protein